jgi:hypothetical protein
MSTRNDTPTALQVADKLASRLESFGADYAFGGAIALGFWIDPRATVDVDVTLYLDPAKPTSVLQCLGQLGCEFDLDEAVKQLREHGFCHARLDGRQVDVFLPTTPFYEAARSRRVRRRLIQSEAWVWDAASLAVFKLMFFRAKDFADVVQMLRVQGPLLDRGWVREQLESICGRRDPRLNQWDELVEDAESPP